MGGLFESGTQAVFVQELTPTAIKKFEKAGFEVVAGEQQSKVKEGGCNGISGILFKSKHATEGNVETVKMSAHTINGRKRCPVCCVLTLPDGDRIALVSAHVPHHKSNIDANTDPATGVVKCLIEEALKLTACSHVVLGADFNASVALVVQQLAFKCEQNYKIAGFTLAGPSIILRTDKSVDGLLVVTVPEEPPLKKRKK